MVTLTMKIMIHNQVIGVYSYIVDFWLCYVMEYLTLIFSSSSDKGTVVFNTDETLVWMLVFHGKKDS